MSVNLVDINQALLVTSRTYLVIRSFFSLSLSYTASIWSAVTYNTIIILVATIVVLREGFENPSHGNRKVKRIWQISNTTLILCRKGIGRYKKPLLSPTQCRAGCPSRRKSRCSPECLACHLQFNDEFSLLPHATFNSMMQTTLNDEFSLVAHVT